VKDLPGNWKDSPTPRSTKDFGTAILKKGRHSIIKIPSVVIPFEYNYLVNPLHAGIESCKLVSVHDYVYDVRLKTK